MKNLCFMGLFTLLMTVAFAGQTVSTFSFVSPAFASSDADKEAAKVAKKKHDEDKEKSDSAEEDYQTAKKLAEEAEKQAEESGSEDDEKAAKQAKEDAEESEKLAKEAHDKSDESEKEYEEANNLANAFSCPEGVSTCYRADGSEYLDVNNFDATAAGGEDDDDKDSLVKVVNPRHFRSF